MNVLLINPPIEDFYFTPQRVYPLGLLSLATVLEREGFNVKILNCTQDYIRRAIKIPREFSYLKKYYQPNESPFCLFKDYQRFGCENKVIIDTLKSFRPAIVGISANFSAYYDSGIEVAGIVKNFDKRIIVVMGGRAATVFPLPALENRNVDFVLKGEAEYTLLKFCRSFGSSFFTGIPGLCYRKKEGNFSISKTKGLIRALDTLPFLNIKLIDYEKYRYKGDISVSLLASRGCAFKCGFCAIDGPFRYRAAGNVINEIERCYQMGVRHFNFEDDNINLNPEFEKILDVIIEKFSGKLKISFMNGLLSLGIDKNIKNKLLLSGITHLNFSMVSSDSAFRKKMGRRENTGNMFRLADYMARKNINSTVHFIIAFPGQRFKDALRDLRLLASRRVFLGPSVFYPVIESRMFSQVKNESFLDERSYKFFRNSTACFDSSMSRDRIFLILYFSRVINFIKEIIDSSDIKDSDFSGFLKRNAVFSGDEDIFLSDKRISRLNLGIMLLERLMRDFQMRRVIKLKTNGIYQYRFIKEDFVPTDDVKLVISGLKIRGVKGSEVSLPVLNAGQPFLIQ